VVVEIGQRSETVRRANLSAVIRELHVAGPLSRSELVARTGLTRSTIRGLVGELVAADLLSEGPARSSGTPGRPSPVVRTNPEGAVVLALEVAVDSLAVAVVGLGGQVLELIRIDRARGHSLVEEITTDLADLVAVVRSHRPPDEDPIGIGTSIVGVVRRTDGLVSMAPNLGWIDVPLGERLRRALDTALPIAVANDADLGALAEVRRGAAIGADHVLFISAEVGIGGGLIVDGMPFTGVAGYAGEVGHIPVNPNGLPCHCGSVGCWETEVGADALLRRARRRTGSGRAEVEAVLRSAASGEPIAVAAVGEVAQWLGFGLAGLVNIFNPRLIVVGGLFGRLHPLVCSTVDAELDRLALPAPRALVRLVAAALGDDAPLLGAAELAFEPLLADPARWLRRPIALPERATA
jgi:predicted NBD/HSP70 family sugar kinase